LKKIGFCIIVKNESHVIERCLDSVKQIIDYVLIVDTGSDDNTIDVINNWIESNNVPGKVISEPWQNFSYNRTFALERLREIDWIDYSLMIDADETLSYDEGFDSIIFKQSLVNDFYDVRTNLGGHLYNRPQLTSNKREYKYVGVVHEFLEMTNAGSRGIVNGFTNIPIQDSNRNRGSNKFLQDIELLKEAISKEEDGSWLKSRYTFYLAQSYRDSGNPQMALETYLKRAEQGYWNEEQYVSLFNAGNIMRDLGYPKSEVIQTYMRAHELLPHRAEALYGVVYYCRIHALHHQGYIIGKHAINIPMPTDSLFTETWIYNYALLDEYAIVCFWSGHYQDSLDACEIMLSSGRLPQHYIGRIEQNRQYAIDRM